MLFGTESSYLSLPACCQHSSALSPSVSNQIALGFFSPSVLFFFDHSGASVHVLYGVCVQRFEASSYG